MSIYEIIRIDDDLYSWFTYGGYFLLQLNNDYWGFYM